MVLKSSHVIQQKHSSVQTLSPVGQGSPHAEDELPPPLLQASTHEWHDTDNSRNLEEMIDDWTQTCSWWAVDFEDADICENSL